MAYEESLRSISLNADASLATYTGVPGQPGSADPNYGKIYRFVKVTGANQVGLVTSVNDTAIGVIQNKPQVTGQSATVAIRGVSNLTSGAAIAAGAKLTTDSTGRATTATTLAAPVITDGGAASGGSFAADDYFWVVTAVNEKGETVVSNELTKALTLNQKFTINWSAITGATGYRIYRGTTTAVYDTLVANVGLVTTYADLGAAGTAATPPTSNTAVQPVHAIALTACDGANQLVAGLLRIN